MLVDVREIRRFAGWCAGVRLLRAAVLAAVARERPGEAEPLALARSHFGCTRDAAADLLHSAEARSLP